MRDTVLAAAIGFGMLLAVGVSAMLMRGSGGPSEGGAEPPPAHAESEGAAAQRASGPPPPRVVEDCNRYARETDKGRVVRDGVIGGAIGAGVGAAAGAIADKSVAGGAGIGALVGAAAGTLYGINEENKKSEQARAAYSACLARNGYQ